MHMGSSSVNNPHVFGQARTGLLYSRTILSNPCLGKRVRTTMKRWMIVPVETEIEWPAEETTFQFMGQMLTLRPPQEDSAADVCLEYEHPLADKRSFETICRFLSAFSWWQHRPARAGSSISCTTPMRCGKRGFGPPTRKGYNLLPT